MQYFNDKPVNFFESSVHAAKLLNVSVGAVRNYISGKSHIEGYRFEKMDSIHTYDIDPELYNIFSEEHLSIKSLLLKQCREKTIARNKQGVKRICQYDKEGHFIKVYDSIAEAQNELHLQGNISHVLSDDNISKSAGGFQWKYDNGDYSDIAPLKNNGKAVAQISSSSGKIIAKFESMAEAERKTGIDHRQIWKCCQGLHKTSGGFVWKYEEE